MKPAICTSFNYDIPLPRALTMIREAGFEVVSVGASLRHSDYTTAAGRAAISSLLEESGLAAESVHAPFPEGDRLFDLDESERVQSVRQCEVALDAAAELGGPIVVVHLLQPYGIPPGDVRERMIEQGRRSIGTLAAQAEARGVALALENGQERAYDEVLACLLDEFDGDQVGLCYDSGHENVQGTCFRMLEEFGHRLITLHVHDNHGSDTHALPYDGTIDWARFREVLHGLDYSGNLLLEAGMQHSQFGDPEVFLSQAKERAERLCE